MKINRSHLKRLRNQLRNNWYWLKGASYVEVYDIILASLKCKDPEWRLPEKDIFMWEKIVNCKSEEEALHIIEEIYDEAFTNGWDLSDEKDDIYFGNIKYNNYLNYIRE